jgi:hypothetical protein
MVAGIGSAAHLRQATGELDHLLLINLVGIVPAATGMLATRRRLSRRHVRQGASSERDGRRPAVFRG